ncbi:acyltransferase [Bradyrhizobium sp. 149]|uniref:acyltransferase family protein n=1 Tax=Bradyrhizobium sp. 149 TaxID=2782624 RepID=UPI001FF9527C|nr:acyltransferase family protein [Bradyrhizobium sp. 149]MCK1652724.1 acyltransferase [Bradyrhizobium sp. 149]
MNDRRPEIDGLRTIAVGGVLLCHFRSTWFPGGYAGVDVFFVISGYLITGQIIREIGQGSFRFRSFYQRRVRRIFPALLAVIVSTLFVGALFFSPDRMRELGASSIAAILAISNILFWSQQGYFEVSAILKPLLHTWSLGIEEQFYGFWPLLLFILPASRNARLAAVVAILIASLAANIAFRDHTSSIFFLLPFRAFEFCIGALTTLIERKTAHRTCGLTTVGLGMVLTSYVIFDETTGFPSYPALLPAVGTAFIILGGANRSSRLLLGTSAMLYLGARSYSLYLVHWPVAVFYSYLTAAPWGWRTGLWLTVASIGLSEILYRTVEQPFRYPTRGARIGNPIFIRSTLAFAFTILALAATCYQSGWIWRLGDRGPQYSALSASPARNYGGDGCGNSCETNPGKPVIAYFIGDSNAQQYYSALKAEFPDDNIRIVQFSSCPFFSTEYTRDFSEHSDPSLYDKGCRASRAAAFEQMRRSPATIVVSQIWLNFPLISESTGKRLRFSDFSAAAPFYADQLSSLATSVGAASLLVIGSIPGAPEQQQDPVDCLFRPIRLQNSCQASKLDAGRKARNIQLAAALGERATFINPMDALCDGGGTCRLIDGTVPIYSDANHLTHRGAELVLDHFRDVLHKGILDKH